MENCRNEMNKNPLAALCVTAAIFMMHGPAQAGGATHATVKFK